MTSEKAPLTGETRGRKRRGCASSVSSVICVSGHATHPRVTLVPRVEERVRDTSLARPPCPPNPVD
eukprot:43844-Eustigmatos_ZCMA.PRE.1